MAIRSTDKRPIDEVSDTEDNSHSSKVKRAMASVTQQQAAELQGSSETASSFKANIAGRSDGYRELPIEAGHRTREGWTSINTPQRPLKEVDFKSAQSKIRDQHNNTLGCTKSSSEAFLVEKVRKDGQSHGASTSASAVHGRPSKNPSGGQISQIAKSGATDISQVTRKISAPIRAKKAHPPPKLLETKVPPFLGTSSPISSKAEFQLPVKLSKKTSTFMTVTALSKPQDPNQALDGSMSPPLSARKLSQLPKRPKASSLTLPQPKLMPDGLLSLPAASAETNSSFLPKKIPRVEHDSTSSKSGMKKPGLTGTSSPPPAAIGHGKYPWTPEEINYLQLYYNMLIVKASSTPIEIPMLKLVREDFNNHFAGRIIKENVHPRRTIASTTAKVNNVCMELKQRLEDIHNEDWDAEYFEKFRPVISQENIDAFGALKNTLHLRDSQAMHPELEKLVADMMDLPVPDRSTPSGADGLMLLPSIETLEHE